MVEHPPRPPVIPQEPRETLATGWRRFMYSRKTAGEFPTLWGIEDKQVIPQELWSAMIWLQDHSRENFGAFVWKQNGRGALVDCESRVGVDGTFRSDGVVAGQIRQSPKDRLLMGLLTYAAYLSHGKIIHPNNHDTLPFDTIIIDLESSLEDRIPYLTNPEKIAELLESTHPDVKNSIRILLSGAFDQLNDGLTKHIALKDFDFKNAFFLAVLEALSGDAPLVCIPKSETTKPFPYQGENGLVVTFAEDAPMANEPQTELGKWLVAKLTTSGGFAEMRERLSQLPENLAQAKLVERLSAAYQGDTTLQTLLRKQHEAKQAETTAQKERLEKAWRDLLNKHKQLVGRVSKYEAGRFKLFSPTPEKVKAALVLPKEVIERRDIQSIERLTGILDDYCWRQNIK